MKLKIQLIISVFILGLLFGHIFLSVQNKPVKKDVIKSDVMPLENGGEVYIELNKGKKFLVLNLEDLEYLSKRKSRVKNLVENLTALFERME